MSKSGPPISAIHGIACVFSHAIYTAPSPHPGDCSRQTFFPFWRHGPIATTQRSHVSMCRTGSSKVLSAVQKERMGLFCLMDRENHPNAVMPTSNPIRRLQTSPCEMIVPEYISTTTPLVPSSATHTSFLVPPPILIQICNFVPSLSLPHRHLRCQLSSTAHPPP